MGVSLGNRDIILSLVGWNSLGKSDTMGTGGEIRKEATLDHSSAKPKLRSQVIN